MFFYEYDRLVGVGARKLTTHPSEDINNVVYDEMP